MRSLLIVILFTSSFSVFSNQIMFTENAGQWESSIRFKANIPGGFLLVKDNSLEYVFYDTKALGDLHGKNQISFQQIPLARVKVDFVESNNVSQFKLAEPVSRFQNYFIGNDKSKWAYNVKSYKEIVLKNLYDNIDFRIYTTHGKLKYEYIIAPGGDPASIQIAYQGVKNVQITDDALLIETDVNVFKEFNPYTFQEIDNKQFAINSHFIKKNKYISFNLGPYDTSKTLTIDPELVFSTYSGSFSDNWAHTATYDSDGNLYAGGSVFGESFFITEDALQQNTGGASRSTGAVLTTDIVIQKYSSDGSELLYSTFLGGLGSEVPHSLVVNSRGELVIFGTTSSGNFPTTTSAYDTTFNGGIGITGSPITSNITYRRGSDLFVSVINPTGTELVGSTFIGGSDNDGINDTRSLEIRNYGDEFRGEVVVDASNNIFVATVSQSVDFPFTDSSTINGSGDAVIFRLSPNCGVLEWSTALGGLNYGAAFSLKVSEQKFVYVCGVATGEIPNISKTFKRGFSGSSDGFIAKFVNDKLAAFTYIGTDEAEIALLLDLDKNGNVYVLGLSTGSYPVTPGVYRNADSGQFIQALDADLAESVFSTVFGSGRGSGIVDIVPTAFLVNDCGNMYISGWGGRVNINTGLNTNSSTSGLPTTRNAFKRTTTGSNYYFSIIEANARSLLYGSFFGSEAPPLADNERGDHLDGGTCRFDKKGVIYHAACVCKADTFVGFPLKNANVATHNSTNCNLAAFKFEIDALVADFNYSSSSGGTDSTFCSNTDLILENTSLNALTYEWFVNDTLISRQTEPKYAFKKAGRYDLKLIAYNSSLCIKADSTVRQINVIDFNPHISADTSVCPGSRVTLLASGGDQYYWSENVGVANINQTEFTIEPRLTDTYLVEIKKEVCKIVLPVEIIVSDEKPDFKVTPGGEVCLGDSVILSASGGFEEFIWEYGNVIDTVNKVVTVFPTETTNFRISAFYKDGCKPIKTGQLFVDKSFTPSFRSAYSPICGSRSRLSFENLTTNASSYEWDFGNGVLVNAETPPANIYNELGLYSIKLTSFNEAGCSLSITNEFEYNPWDGQVPNVITPNGDGKNDLLNIGVSDAVLRIYTRWGKLIYVNENYDNTWGEEVKGGTYFYELILPDKSTCKGFIDVIK